LPERDMCIWSFFIATPCLILELNRVQLGDVMTKKGELVKSFVIRGELDFVGDERKIFLTSKGLLKFFLITLSTLLFQKAITLIIILVTIRCHPCF